MDRQQQSNRQGGRLMNYFLTGGTGFIGRFLVEKLLARGARLTQLLKQPQYSPLPVEEQVVSIYAGTRGYLDTIAVDAVTEYEQRMLEDIRANGEDILEEIRTEKKLTEKLESKLNKFLESFTKGFSSANTQKAA